ncbi:unnamed protein product [Prunus armeniaca]|uniref:Uncharacterized protein n=1 Tax=Prunus armeniaca TaxID=36596 RepID=A0A6J5UMH8_PRUAR|nr:unnamed protein product [Prunus armeniaca]
MDLVSSLECLKLDSQSEVLHKDSGGKDLLSPNTTICNMQYGHDGGDNDDGHDDDDDDGDDGDDDDDDDDDDGGNK